MQKPDSPGPELEIVVVAFRGEMRGLGDTLQSLADANERNSVSLLCSDDSLLKDVAKSAGIPCRVRLPDECPTGAYWCAVLREMELDETGVRLILRAGTIVPAHWARRLCFTARKAGASAVFPLSVRHPFTSAFLRETHRPGLDVNALDLWLNVHALRREFDVPVLAGWSALFCGEIWSRPTETDDRFLAARVRSSGGVLVATDSVYLDDSALQVQPMVDGLYKGWLAAFRDRHPFSAVRHALTQLSGRGETPPLEVRPVRPVRLHVSHSWGGGLGRWVEGFVAADEDHESLVLRPIGHWDAFGQTLALYRSACMDVPWRSWTLTEPILSTVAGHHEYRCLLEEILETFAVESVLVSSLIGHSLDVLDTALPTTIILHDFYPVCPPIVATFGVPCNACEGDRLKDCLGRNPLHRFFRVEPVAHWVALREQFSIRLQQPHMRLVAPTKSVASRWRSLLPALGPMPIAVIEHGLDASLSALLARARRTENVASGAPLRLVILGSLASHKGGALLEPVLREMAEFAEVLLIGSGEDGRRLARRPGVTLIAEHYEREALGGLLARHDPDMGLLLSTVPETFSYTLSELRAAGIPVAATDLGAFADRIRHGTDGWLFPPTPADLLNLLRRLHREPDQIATARGNLQAMPVRDTIEMIRDYDALLTVSVSLCAPLQRPVPTVEPISDSYRAEGHLYINHQAPYAQVLRSFLRYTIHKIHQTQRLPKPFKVLLGSFLKPLAR